MPAASFVGVSNADTIAYILGDLALILVAARAVGGVFVRFRQPRIVGEIVAGVLIGPTVLGGTLAVAATPGNPAVPGTGLVDHVFPLQALSFLNGVGQVGLVFFMFLVGLELDLRLLKGRGAQIVTMAVAVTVVPVALGFFVGAVLDGSTWRPSGVGYATFSLFLGAALSVTAFPVMARILQEKGMISTPVGAVGVGSAAVVTVLMFLAIAAASASATTTHEAGVVGQVGAKFGFTVALILFLVIVVRPALTFVTRNWREDHAVREILAFMIVGALAVGLAADRIGINALVGGFLFGLTVPARHGLIEAVNYRLKEVVVLFFLPVFLAVSGLRTNFRLLEWELVPGLLLFLTLMIAGKWFLGYVTGRAVGLTSNEAHLVGVLLNCRGLMILVVGLIGLQLKVITPQMQVVFVCGAIITTLMTGPLVDYYLRRALVSAEDDRQVPVAALT